jgi:hypothetical protein
MSNWLFQGNPKRYPVLDHLLDGETALSWSVSRHLDDLAIHDNAALWVSGSRAGIYAIGRVTGPPFEDEASDDWLDPADRGKRFYFCPLEWDDVRVDHPILKVDLLQAGGFEKARIVSQPMAGNPFMLTDEEWQVIERLR